MTQKQLDAIQGLQVSWENQNEYFELTDMFKDIRLEYVKSIDSAEEFNEYVQERINKQEVIYYATAMEFLTANDDSLNWSFEIASEYGFELQNLNSETLATLLLQRMLMEALEEISGEIEEIFEEEEE